MAIITLTSDWGVSDYYVPAVKGAIYSALPDVNVVDITHNLDPFDLRSAAFIVKNCYRNFPEGTIHILAVETEESIDNPHIAVKVNGHYFIGTDNDVFSLVIDEDPYEAVVIDVMQDTDFFTFSTRDRFVKVAAMIAKGVDLSEIGKPYKLKEKFDFKPAVYGNWIRGIVIFVDAYENVVTNVTKELFEKVRAGRKFSIKLCHGNYEIDEISTGYQDVDMADIVALFGTHGYLEIAMNHGKASSLLGIERDSVVDIYFEDDKDSSSQENTLF